MKFVATADTDIGITKSTNQDSALIKHASTSVGEVMMAIVCDGMGGLEKGELASATVVRSFSRWFDEELPALLGRGALEDICRIWARKLKELNAQIGRYGSSLGVDIGTTFTGVLFVDDRYVFAHVGDSRLYFINNSLKQLTEDQTFVMREVKRGNMTLEQAERDRRRNILLQCVGASKKVEPQVGTGRTERGVYMLCSDGFRHVISPEEIRETFHPVNLMNKKAMHGNARYLIEQAKARKERDNISVILVKVD